MGMMNGDLRYRSCVQYEWCGQGLGAAYLQGRVPYMIYNMAYLLHKFPF